MVVFYVVYLVFAALSPYVAVSTISTQGSRCACCMDRHSGTLPPLLEIMLIL